MSDAVQVEVIGKITWADSDGGLISSGAGEFIFYLKDVCAGIPEIGKTCRFCPVFSVLYLQTGEPFQCSRSRNKQCDIGSTVPARVRVLLDAGIVPKEFADCIRVSPGLFGYLSSCKVVAILGF